MALPPFPRFTLSTENLHINVLRCIAVFKKKFSPSASKGFVSFRSTDAVLKFTDGVPHGCIHHC